ncbi:MAG: peptide deformylase [Planctomycetota bacterium]|nr:peptide deformylase [Planctomycetota bacterium]
MSSQLPNTPELPSSADVPGPEQLNLRFYPDPILHRSCQPLGSPDDRARACIERMFELMYEHQGIGLAAPQVGWNARVFVINIAASSGESDQEWVFIDPQIDIPDQLRGSLEEGEEGCLSLPGIRLEVERPAAISVRATGLDGEPFELQTDGLLARCIQHENDHLDGILIPSRVSTGQRISIKEQLLELEQKWQQGETRS